MLADLFSMLLRFRVSAEIADDGLTLWLCQRWECAFVDKTIHSLQDLLPFLHRPESRIRHPMGHPMVSKGFAMAASATLREHPTTHISANSPVTNLRMRWALRISFPKILPILTITQTLSQSRT